MSVEMTGKNDRRPRTFSTEEYGRNPAGPYLILTVWVEYNYFRFFALHVLGHDCGICMGGRPRTFGLS